jgi:hypothetical protein
MKANFRIWLRTAVFQRHTVREQLGFIITVRLYIFYILQRISALHDIIKYNIYSHSALLLFSPTLGNVYEYGGNALFRS